jgi:hypothetical protein
MSANFVKAGEIADRYRVSRDAVYLWIRQGKIPAECVIRIAGTVRVDEHEFERRLRSGELYRRPGHKPPGCAILNTAAEDNFTVKGEQHRAQHRWTGESGSVEDGHPYAPKVRADTD